MIELNKKTRTAKLTRGEMGNLLLLLSVQDGEKWRRLHDKIKDQFDRQDEKDPNFPKIQE